MRQMSSSKTPPESFILGYLVLHLKNVIVTVNVILETSVMFDDMHLLNKKSEFIGKCRHENKLLLSSIK